MGVRRVRIFQLGLCEIMMTSSRKKSSLKDMAVAVKIGQSDLGSNTESRGRFEDTATIIMNMGGRILW